MVPESGIDFFFGPDLSHGMRTLLDQACASAECLGRLAQSLNSGHEYDIEKRAVGLDDMLGVGAAALMAIVAAGIEAVYARQSGKPPASLHLEPSDVAQAACQTDAEAVLLESGSSVMTIPLTSATTLAEPASATTLAGGDVVVHVPSTVAAVMEKLISRATPPAARGRGLDSTPMTVVTDAAKFVLPLAMLIGVRPAPQQEARRLPAPLDAAARASLRTVEAYAAALPEFHDAAAWAVNAVARIVWWTTFAVCAHHAATLAELVIEAGSWFADDNSNHDACTDPGRGINSPLCTDESCEGAEGGVCSKVRNIFIPLWGMANFSPGRAHGMYVPGRCRAVHPSRVHGDLGRAADGARRPVEPTRLVL